ncbi:hypothetical protein [Falsibacillus albus]|uniref:Uncharacterized protein n=1 Tax=Falsibacillus albus TaxID=2478915 RepID=A0A3L7K2Q1_9BACI|nr:hypothetical protein [Falsibacillus albus]RLQ96261.1 hypothetical protein D9X91_08220 [Falsibacillus albus]
MTDKKDDISIDLDSFMNAASKLLKDDGLLNSLQNISPLASNLFDDKEMESLNKLLEDNQIPPARSSDDMEKIMKELKEIKKLLMEIKRKI